MRPDARALSFGAHADAVVAGSAFHWFETDRALAEAHRVLVPGGTLGFAWNRGDARHPAMARVHEAIDAARGGRWRGLRPWSELVARSGLFEVVEQRRFPHVLELPRSALDDFLASYAAIAALPAPARRELSADVAVEAYRAAARRALPVKGERRRERGRRREPRSRRRVSTEEGVRQSRR